MLHFYNTLISHGDNFRLRSFSTPNAAKTHLAEHVLDLQPAGLTGILAGTAQR
jgi:hypothetical protein